MLEHDNTSNDSLNPQSKDTKNEAISQTFNNEISNIQGGFSFYKAPIKNIKPLKIVTLEDVFKLITSNEYEQQTQEHRAILDKKKSSIYKSQNFDYVTFNGIFEERADAKLVKLSGFFSIDIDNIGNNLNKIKNRILNDKELLANLVFTSPSGNGLKIIVRIDISIVNLNAKGKILDNIWQAVNSHIGKKYNDLIKPNEKGEYIDSSCKDLSRACFLCQDKEAYININEEKGLGFDFIEENFPIGKHDSKKTLSTFGDFDIENRLKKLHKTHLFTNDNHYAQVLSFIGASKSVGINKKDLEKYIKENVHISESSSCRDSDKIKNTINDIYTRYPNITNEDVIELNQGKIAHKFIVFKYNQIFKKYLPSDLYLNEIKHILTSGGFMKRKLGEQYIYIQKKGVIIEKVTPEDMRDYMTQYITSLKENFNFNYKGFNYFTPIAEIKEIYLTKSSNIFNNVWLEHLDIHNEPILKDTKDQMHFVFENQIVIVKSDDINFKSLNDINGLCIWEDAIIKHTLKISMDFGKSYFYEFLENITNGNQERLLSFKTGIGYLLHHYFRENEGQAVILYDEAITDIKNPMGGTGKGIIIKALGKVRKTTKIDGKSINKDNRFVWGAISQNTQIVCIDDIKPDFNFENLFSNLTDGWSIESKYKPTLIIEPKDNPKTVISSNSILRGNGNSNARRKFELELSDFYSKQLKNGIGNPIFDTHGCLFFGEDWKTEEWNQFYNVLIHCGQKYLEKNLVPYTGINIKRNLLMQTTNEDFVNWIENQKFELNNNYETKTYFEEYTNLYYGDSKQFAQRTFTKWLKYFAQYKNWKFNTKQSNGRTFFNFESL